MMEAGVIVGQHVCLHLEVILADELKGSSPRPEPGPPPVPAYQSAFVAGLAGHPNSRQGQSRSQRAACLVTLDLPPAWVLLGAPTPCTYTTTVLGGPITSTSINRPTQHRELAVTSLSLSLTLSLTLSSGAAGRSHFPNSRACFLRGDIKLPAERLSRLTTRHSIATTATISFDLPTPR